MAIEIHADGSCIGNPGPGGWASLVKGPSGIIKISGGEPKTTNNRMELTAIIWGIKTVLAEMPEVNEFAIYSDSAWVINTMTKNWKRKKNLDLWNELAPLLINKKISWHWVKGHAGHKENEDCDTRALKEAMKQKKLNDKNPNNSKFYVEPGENNTLF